MSKIYAVMLMQLRTVRNTLRTDTRMRVTWTLALLFALAGSIWGIKTLLYQLIVWRADSAVQLHYHLWLLLLGCWSGTGILSILATLREGLNEQEALLLFTLPLSSAERFRLLCATILLRGPGIWLLLFAVVLTITLGWSAFVWLLLSLVGILLVSLCCMLATLLLICYLLPTRLWMQMMTILGALMVVTVLVALSVVQHPVMQPFMPNPLLIVLIFLLSLLILLGPGASLGGAIYSRAFYTLQGRLRRPRTLTPPGMRWFCERLSYWRSLTGAMLVKAFFYQGRNPFNWLRLLVIFAYLLPFPWCYHLVISYDISKALFMMAYLAVMVLLCLIDASPSPFGGEGNRLVLYLTAPLTTRVLLRAKLMTFLLPALCLAFLLSIALGGWLHMPLLIMVPIVSQVFLLIIGPITLLTLGSVWDEDLSIVVEGAIQMLLHEQLPITPRRIWLIGLTYLLLAIMLLLLWKLPLLLAYIFLFGIDLAIMWCAFTFAQYYVHRILKCG